jgi:hypothetical protein
MKVLVWKSYGDIKVYAAETAEQLEGIVNTMIACVEKWDIDAEIKMATDHMAKHKGDRKEIVRAFNTIKNAAGSDDETFEDIFLTTVLEECA